MLRNFTRATITLMLVAGCGSSSPDYSSGTPATNPGASVVAPNFLVQGPTANGQVTVANAGGQVLAQGPAVAGLASLSLPPGILLPAENVNAQATAAPLQVTFIVEDGDHLNAGDGAASFFAEVPAPHEGDLVGVDAVSSLIALYHRAHPDLTFEQAALEVFEYLQLAADTNPEHLFEDTEFESGLFFAEAQASGGIDALLQRLVGEVSASSDSGGRFLQANAALPGIFDLVARKLAASVLNYAQNQADQAESRVIGFLEGLIGIGGGGPSIQDVLDSLNSLREDINRLSQKIDQQTNIITYGIKDAVVAPLRAASVSDNRTLTEYADPNNGAPPNQAQVGELMSRVRDRYSSALTLINTQELPQAGPGGGEGLIGLYLNSVVPRLYGAPQKEKATYHLRRSLGFQQLVLNLLVEAYHFATPSLLLDAELAVDDYFDNAKEQRQQYPLAFDEEKLLLDRQNNRLWTRKPVVLGDARTVSIFVQRYIVDNSPAGSWRIPTADEMDTLVSATGGTGRDQHTELGMLREGFLPINGSNTVGDWRIGPFNWKVLVGSTFINNNGMQGTFIHVSNFRRSTESIANLDFRTGGLGDPTGPVAFYLIRDLPHITNITVTEKTRSGYTASYVATARLSDGSERDVTEVVRWSLQSADGVPITHSTARISNVPESDGVITYRAATSPAMKVSAVYNDVEGTFDAPATNITLPPVTEILISPLRYVVPSDGYTGPEGKFQKAFDARTVRANGATADANATVTWRSSDSHVTVSSQGLVTATRPSVRTTVIITAISGSVSREARLVLNP